MLGADLLGDGGLDGAEGAIDGLGAAQVQLHAAHIRLVGNGLGVDLEDHRVADFAGGFHRRAGIGRDDGLGDGMP